VKLKRKGTEGWSSTFFMPIYCYVKVRPVLVCYWVVAFCKVEAVKEGVWGIEVPLNLSGPVQEVTEHFLLEIVFSNFFVLFF